MQSEYEQLSHVDDPDWEGLEARLAEFARLARSEAPHEEVAREMLDNLLQASAAIGVVLWASDETGLPKVERRVGGSPVTQSEDSQQQRRLVLRSMLTRRQVVIPPGAEGDQPNPSEYPLLRVPVLLDREPVALIEVVQRPGVDQDVIEGNLRFVALLAELYADRLRRRELRDLKRRQGETERFDDFLYALHRASSPKALAAELANEGRSHLGCDRVSVALRSGSIHRVIAVSSVDSINRRSAAIRALERLATRVAATGETLIREESDPDCPPQVEEALHQHLDESHARRLAVVPLRGPSTKEGAKTDEDRRHILGALVVENFDADDWGNVRSRLAAVAEHGGLALANALRLQSARRMPFLGGRGAVATDAARGAMLRWVAFGLLALAVASTFVIQTDFDLHVQGTLRPVDRRHVFAPMDGQIAEVFARHGDTVAAGEPVARMTSTDLDLEIQTIQGEHDATVQRAAAIESAMLEQGATRQRDPARLSKLAAEQEELRQLFQSQQRRLELLREQRERLVVRSTIAGEVLTWEAEETLLNRPVQRGQSLMTVADLEGAWEAEIDTPYEAAGPLLELLEGGADKVDATIELALDRDTEYHGLITGVAKRVEMGADNEAVLRARVALDDAELKDPRPGATVFAKVHCGRRSVFYVWCHDILQRIQGWLYL